MIITIVQMLEKPTFKIVGGLMAAGLIGSSIYKMLNPKPPVLTDPN